MSGQELFLDLIGPALVSKRHVTGSIIVLAPINKRTKYAVCFATAMVLEFWEYLSSVNFVFVYVSTLLLSPLIRLECCHTFSAASFTSQGHVPVLLGHAHTVLIESYRDNMDIFFLLR